MDGGDAPPIAGWYPDPSAESSYRWWDGNAWTAGVRSDEPAPRLQGRLEVRVLLVSVSVVLWLWASVWFFLLPFLDAFDTDNSHLWLDFTTLWLPNFVAAVGGAVACLLALGYEKRRPALWRILAIPGAALVLVVLVGVAARRVP